MILMKGIERMILMKGIESVSVSYWGFSDLPGPNWRK
jgi:hypothetical protein